MRRTFPYLLCAFLIGNILSLTFASGAYGATGNLAIYDEALENGNDCSSTGGQPGFHFER
ncbi:MAG TPA: hypothetical protein VFI49_11040 [Rudaea sp.]|nr:hypothetical protein [Rudaea sp.]